MSISNQQFPAFLDDYGSLYSHLSSEFAGLNNTNKGDLFVDFSIKRAYLQDGGGQMFYPSHLRKEWIKPAINPCDPE